MSYGPNDRQPFTVGDLQATYNVGRRGWIIVDLNDGEVEEIGFANDRRHAERLMKELEGIEVR